MAITPNLFRLSKMLKSAELFNFRLHKHLKIDFGTHITSIVGKSYSGKSTVVRALKWVFLNKPSGLSVVRWGAKQTKVIVKIDGHTIVRIRGKSKNIYKLDGQKFEAFGNDVPRKIVALLNVSEKNFQEQHSLPFWFGETAGEVSRQLNGIVNLSIIDTTMANLASELRTAKTTVEVSKTRLKQAKDEKTQLSFVPQMIKDWENVLALDKAYEKQSQNVAEIDSVLNLAKDLKRVRDKARPPSIITMDKYAQEYESLSNEVVSIDNSIRQAKRLKQVWEVAQAEARKAHESLETVSKGRCPLCGRKR